MVHLKKKQDVFYLLLKQYNLKDVVFFKNENDWWAERSVR